MRTCVYGGLSVGIAMRGREEKRVMRGREQKRVMCGREEDTGVLMLRMCTSDLTVRRSGKRAGRDDGMSARRARPRSGRSEKIMAQRKRGMAVATDARQEVDVSLVRSTTTDWSGARCTEVLPLCMCAAPYTHARTHARTRAHTHTHMKYKYILRSTEVLRLCM